MRPVRVLLIAPSMRIIGGQSIQANRLIHYLGQRSDVDVSFLAFDASLPNWIADVPVVRTALRSVLYWIALAGRAWRYDILHVFTASYWSYTLWSLPALLAAKLYRKKIVLNYRDGRAEDHLRSWRSAVPTIRRMDAVVAPSGYLGVIFAHFGIACRSIHNVMDMETFRFRDRSPLQPRFLHNRAMEALYNIPCVLRAFVLVQARYANASLTVVGDGPMRPQLERLAVELGLRNTRFLGAVPNRHMPQLLDNADLYITLPDIDCMPGSILECYASGLPVIASKAGGIPFIATDRETAMLVDCGDHQAAAQAAIRVIEDPVLAKRLARQAYDQCRRLYAGDEVARQWAELYHELAAPSLRDAR